MTDLSTAPSIVPTVVPPNAWQSAIDALTTPWWHKPDFWIATILGVAGVYFSVRAYREAARAAEAARQAGRGVKIQTIVLELTEVLYKLQKIQPNIRFSDARELLIEVSRWTRRLIAPFQNDATKKDTITQIREALTNAQVALKSVRPTDPSKENEVLSAVYNGIEGSFQQLGDLIADLLGLFESETLDIDNGENDARA